MLGYSEGEYSFTGLTRSRARPHYNSIPFLPGLSTYNLKTRAGRALVYVKPPGNMSTTRSTIKNKRRDTLFQRHASMPLEVENCQTKAANFHLHV